MEKVTPSHLKIKMPNDEVKEEFRSIVPDYTRLDESKLEESTHKKRVIGNFEAISYDS